MATAQISAAEPLSSYELPITDTQRLAEIELRQRRIGELLETVGAAALLLQRPANISWFTSGADIALSGSADSTAALLITRDARVLLTSNVDSPQWFDFQIPELGFQLKERPWTESRQSLIDDVCRGRQIASDVPGTRWVDVGPRMLELRLPLSELECDRLRTLGRDVAHSLEATARHLVVGRTEAEIAGEVAHRLMKRMIVPERIQVAGDGRFRRYRHWTPSDRPVEHFCVISAVGRRHGLSVGATRMVCFGEAPESLWNSYARLSLVHATAMFFSQANWPLHEVWSRVGRIYEKFGHADEWRLSEQGEVVGYSPCEVPVLPKSEFPLSAGVAVHWHPSIGPAAAGDTVLVRGDQVERVTAAGDEWPLLTVEVKGVPTAVPDLLMLPRSMGILKLSERTDIQNASPPDEGDSVLNLLSGDSVLLPPKGTPSVLD